MVSKMAYFPDFSDYSYLAKFARLGTKAIGWLDLGHDFQTSPLDEDVLKALGAKKSEVLWNVGLPRAMPYFFASLKVAVTLAFVGTVLSETVAANRGIGNVMMVASSNFDVPLVFRWDSAN